jgi:predicted PP-loop superfamily ATPase
MIHMSTRLPRKIWVAVSGGSDSQARSLHMEFVCAWPASWCNQSPMCTNECDLTA